MTRRKEIPFDVAALAISVQGRSANLIAALLRAAKLHRIDPNVLLNLGEESGAEDMDRMVRALLIRHPGLSFIANGCRIEMPALARVAPTDYDDEESKHYQPDADTKSLTEPFVLRLATILLPNEGSINFNDRDSRLQIGLGGLPGYQHARYLVRNQETPAIATELARVNGQTIYFPSVAATSPTNQPANLRMMLVMRKWHGHPWKLDWDVYQKSTGEHDLFAVPGR